MRFLTLALFLLSKFWRSSNINLDCRMLSNFRFVIAVTLIVGVGPVAIGQPPPPPKPQPVQVTTGKPITLTGSLKGYDLKRYSFQGKAKRTLNLQVSSGRGN